jgi:transcriptional regulator with XRE-family HTH domain
LENADKLLEQIGRRIAELRENGGKTQAQVAEKVGMTVSNYQRIEHGLQNLSVKTMIRVAAAIGVLTAELFVPSKKLAAKRGRPKRRSGA